MTAVPAPAPQRENVFDLLRGIAIIGVVYIHSAKLLSPAYPLVLDTNYFRWAVPVFLLLSALFSIRSYRKRPVETADFLARRYRKLIWPFLVVSLLQLVLTADWKTLTPVKIITRHFTGAGWPGQYFFIVLFQLLLFYPWFAKIRWTRRGMVACGALTLLSFPVAGVLMNRISLLEKLGDKIFIYWLPYTILGAYLAQEDDLLRQLPQRFNRWLAGAIALFAPCLIVLEFHFNPLHLTLPVDGGSGLYVSPYVLDSVFLSSVGVFLFSPSVLSAWRGMGSATVSALGRYSLGIFCLHPLLLWGVKLYTTTHPWLATLPYTLQALSPLLSVAVLCFASLGLTKIIEHGLGRDVLS